MLDIALAKGRLADETLKRLIAADIVCTDVTDDSRKLIFEDLQHDVRLFMAKPSDVGVYVERGVADIGIVGKDCLLEQEPHIYELLDLGFGKCHIAMAAPVDFKDDQNAVLRVATKYERVARSYFASLGRQIDVIKLSGSIELAPIIGLSDCIVDIVETGRTLKENGLEVFATITKVSARLIANRSNYEFKREEINRVIQALK